MLTFVSSFNIWDAALLIVVPISAVLQVPVSLNVFEKMCNLEC